jgi:hypothetical protein
MRMHPVLEAGGFTQPRDHLPEAAILILGDPEMKEPPEFPPAAHCSDAGEYKPRRSAG